MKKTKNKILKNEITHPKKIPKIWAKSKKKLPKNKNEISKKTKLKKSKQTNKKYIFMF